MIGCPNVPFGKDPFGQIIVPLTLSIAEMETQKQFGMEFFQTQVAGIHFYFPGIEIKKPS